MISQEELRKMISIGLINLAHESQLDFIIAVIDRQKERECQRIKDELKKIKDKNCNCKPFNPDFWQECSNCQMYYELIAIFEDKK